MSDGTVINATPLDQDDSGEGTDDVLNGGKGADTLDGGGGDDILNGGAGADSLLGGDGSDQLNAGSGDDILEGGDGDDVLNGGGGSDVFRFFFTVASGGTQTITYDPVPLDYDAPTGGGPNQVPADGDVSPSEFAEFSQDYQDWLDANAPADYEYDAPQPDPVTSASDPDLVDGSVSSVELTNNQDRYWEPTIEVGGGSDEITASDGNDTIAQFQNAGPNVDTIELWGITHDQAMALFTYESDDYNGDSVADSKISWGGEAGSITILGSAWGDLEAFLTDDRVLTQDELV